MSAKIIDLQKRQEKVFEHLEKAAKEREAEIIRRIRLAVKKLPW